MRTRHGVVTGVVASWSHDEGWGVLTTPEGLSVFCSVFQLDRPGYRAALAPGSTVDFDYETPGQDGCDARVATSASPHAGATAGVPLEAGMNLAEAESLATAMRRAGAVGVEVGPDGPHYIVHAGSERGTKYVVYDEEDWGRLSQRLLGR